MARGKKKKPVEQRTLTAYLAARNTHRFERREPVDKDAGRRRLRLLVLALVLGGVGLWGILREFLL